MLSMMRKEFAVILRDRTALLILFLSPLAFIVVMSLALGQAFSGLSATTTVSIAVVDQDHSAASQALVDSLTQAKGLRIEGDIGTDRAEAEILVANGEAVLALVIPDGFGAAAVRGDEVPITLITDPGQSSQVITPTATAVTSGATVVAADARAATALITAAQSTADPTVAAQLTDAANEIGGGAVVAVTNSTPAGTEIAVQPTVYQQNVPGYAIMYVFFIVTTMASSIMIERREGTFRRLLSTRLPRWGMLGGKVLPYTAVAVAQVLLLITFGRFVFGMQLGAHPVALIPLTVSIAVCATALGVLLASFAKSDAQVTGLGTIVILILAALGGCMVPLVFMPEFMTAVAKVTPHGQALIAFQDVMVRDAGVSDILPACAVLLGYAALFFLVASPRWLR